MPPSSDRSVKHDVAALLADRRVRLAAMAGPRQERERAVRQPSSSAWKRWSMGVALAVAAWHLSSVWPSASPSQAPVVPPSAEQPMAARAEAHAKTAPSMSASAIQAFSAAPLPAIPLDTIGPNAVQVVLPAVPLSRPQVAPLIRSIAPAAHVPIVVEEGDTTQTLAAKLVQAHRPFLALAVTMEALRTQPYWDAAGINVGMGYCVPKRVQEYGEARVRADLSGVGLSETAVETLLHGKRAAQKALVLTKSQALHLLVLTEPDYTTIARAFVGEGFDALPAHRQASLTWLAYNVGDRGLAQFRMLSRALQHQQWTLAGQHMMPSYTDATGHRIENTRAGALLAQSFASDRGLWAVVAPQLTYPAPPGAAVTPASAPPSVVDRLATRRAMAASREASHPAGPRHVRP